MLRNSKSKNIEPMTPDDCDSQISDVVASNNKQLPVHQVRKSHLLLMSPQNLSSKEHDMLLLFCSKVNGDKYKLPPLVPGAPQSEQDKSTEVPTFIFEGDVLEDWFKIQRKQMSSTLAPVAARLAVSMFGYKNVINQEDGEFKYRTLFSEISYKRSTLKFIPNPLMWRMLIDYSKGYALINHTTFRSIQSEYGKQLYQLLSRWKEEHNQLRKMTIRSLQDLFGVYDSKGKAIKTSLAVPNTFIKRVIDQAIKKISDSSEAKKELIFHTDEESNTFGYKLTKSGKGGKSTHIEFLYYWVENKKIPLMTDAKAKKIISDLDVVKRVTKKEKLTIEEYKHLYQAYKQLNLDERALRVLEGIKRLKNKESNEPVVIDAPSQSSMDIEAKLRELEDSNDMDGDY